MEIKEIPVEKPNYQITLTEREKRGIRKALMDLNWDRGNGDGYEELYHFYNLIS